MISASGDLRARRSLEIKRKSIIVELRTLIDPSRTDPGAPYRLRVAYAGDSAGRKIRLVTGEGRGWEATAAAVRFRKSG